MNDKKQDYMIKSENYFTLSSIVLLLFILMMVIVNLNYFFRKGKEKIAEDTKNILYKSKEDKQASIDPSCLIVAGEAKTHGIEIIEESLENSKIKYNSKIKFEDITEDELKSARVIIIDGSKFSSLGKVDMLFKYIERGKSLVFTSIPEVDYVEVKALKEILGIKDLNQSVSQEGVSFLSGFMLGGLLEFPKLSYIASEVELNSKTKTYVISSKESPIIWRNIYGKSEIYVVNGSFSETNAGYGIISAIMAQIYTDYIYPVFNAKVFTYTGLPYVSHEDNIKLYNMYSRNAMQLQQDILIPDILSINSSRDFIPSCFFTDNFNKGYSEEINKYTAKQINNYERDIYKLGGEVGMVYSGDLQRDINRYNALFNNKNFKNILLTKENLGNLDEPMRKEQFTSIESVLGPWTVKEKNFRYINENTVYIPFTVDGLVNTDMEKLEFYSRVTAFGAIIQNLNLEQILFPQQDKDNWIEVLRQYTKFIDSYRNKFKMIKSRNITEAAKLVKVKELSSPSINYINNKIEIRFKEWYGEANYILRTNKEVDSITNGTIEKIEDGAYLVTAKSKEVDINLLEIDRYK